MLMENVINSIIKLKNVIFFIEIIVTNQCPSISSKNKKKQTLLTIWGQL